MGLKAPLEIARCQNGWEKCVSFCIRDLKKRIFGKTSATFTYFLIFRKCEMQFEPLYVQPKLALKFPLFFLFKKTANMAFFLQF